MAQPGGSNSPDGTLACKEQIKKSCLLKPYAYYSNTGVYFKG